MKLRLLKKMVSPHLGFLPAGSEVEIEDAKAEILLRNKHAVRPGEPDPPKAPAADEAKAP